MTEAKETAPAIRVENLRKVFTGMELLGPPRGDTVARAFLNILGFKVPMQRRDGPRATFADQGPALDGVSFEVAPSSVAVLSGPSGSGKTVLLEVLAGVLAPTGGRAELRGLVSSMIRPGSNLEMTMSALENIRRHEQLQPPSKRMALDVDQIIAFAGIEGFERLPVRKYSSGMKMRLSLAIALHGRPDVLLIDDVLRVGDIAFQETSRKRLLELKSAGTAILFASSDDEFTAAIADRVIEMRDGKIVRDRSAAATKSGGKVRSRGGTRIDASHFAHENDAIATTSVEARRIASKDRPFVRIRLGVKIKAPSRVRACIDVMRGNRLAFRSLAPRYVDFGANATATYSVDVPLDLLAPGKYTVASNFVSLLPDEVLSLKSRDIVKIHVGSDREDGDAPLGNAILSSKLSWETHALEEPPELAGEPA